MIHNGLVARYSDRTAAEVAQILVAGLVVGRIGWRIGRKGQRVSKILYVCRFGTRRGRREPGRLGHKFVEELEQFFVNYHAMNGKKYCILDVRGPKEAKKRVEDGIRGAKKAGLRASR